MKKGKLNLDFLLDVDLTPDFIRDRPPKDPPFSPPTDPNPELKPVPSAPGYCASADGRVWSVKSGKPRELKQRFTRDRYLVVNISEGDRLRTETVHKLVLEAFVGVRPAGIECRHLNDIRTDNRADNLKWGTSQENSDDMIINLKSRRGLPKERKLTRESVAMLKGEHRDGCSIGSLSRKYNATRRTVRDIIRGVCWKDVI